VLAVQAQGGDVLTIEGLANGDRLHPIQEAFWDVTDCSVASVRRVILSAHQLLIRNPKPTENEIRHALDGNLCRCTGYQHIVTRSNTRRKRMREKPKTRRRS